MNKTGRLRQYIFKASFSADTDRLEALNLLDEIEKQKISKYEIEQVAEDECQQDWNRLEYKEVYRNGFIDGAEWINNKLA